MVLSCSQTSSQKETLLIDVIQDVGSTELIFRAHQTSPWENETMPLALVYVVKNLSTLTEH